MFTTSLSMEMKAKNLILMKWLLIKSVLCFHFGVWIRACSHQKKTRTHYFFTTIQFMKTIYSNWTMENLKDNTFFHWFKVFLHSLFIECMNIFLSSLVDRVVSFEENLFGAFAPLVFFLNCGRFF